MWSYKLKKYEISRRRYRQHHAEMDNYQAVSYSIMALSDEYRHSYSIYLEFFRLLLEKKNKPLKVLNLGFSTGILENIILSNFQEKVSFTSIDNSEKFREIAIAKNKKYIKKGWVDFKYMDVLNDDYKFDKFDIILSRDLNHHLNEIYGYLIKCFDCLDDDGLMLLEDLRYDADVDAVKDFCNLIFSIRAYENDRWNMYNKLYGLIESFIVSYSEKEIIEILNKTKFSWKNYISPARYHFFLAKNDNTLEQYKNAFFLLFNG